MQLSYTFRLICFALCSAGLLQLLLECAAWMAAPLLFAQSAFASARRAERSMFLLALLARLGPWLVVLGALVPAYMRGEDNLSRERVGWICVAGAGCVVVWSLLCGLRAVRAWMSTRRCCRLCQEAGVTPEGLPMLLHPGDGPLLAVAGLFRSRIIVSQSLLAHKHVSADALHIAFLHEDAHARHRDNLKLAVLSLLPHVSFGTRGRPSLDQQWRLAAEIAADEAGAVGGPERSILLAELLVAMARESNQALPRGSFALLSRADDLRVRVERLLQRRAVEAVAGRSGLQARCAAVFGLALFATLCYVGTELGHRVAEVLLHIG